jgi:N-acetylmuramoyl-L-alanine amidase
MSAIGRIRYLTIHASYTSPSMDIGAKEIRQWHTLPPPAGNGWRDIGYHIVIRRDGTEEIGRHPGQLGAHVGGHNSGNLGLCLVGGREEIFDVPENNFTDAQWTALDARMRLWHREHPDAEIRGHNGFRGHEMRGCPCFDWLAWRRRFFERLNEVPAPQVPSHWYDEVDKE